MGMMRRVLGAVGLATVLYAGAGCGSAAVVKDDQSVDLKRAVAELQVGTLLLKRYAHGALLDVVVADAKLDALRPMWNRDPTTSAVPAQSEDWSPAYAALDSLREGYADRRRANERRLTDLRTALASELGQGDSENLYPRAEEIATAHLLIAEETVAQNHAITSIPRFLAEYTPQDK